MPNIDERIEALVHTMELFQADMKDFAAKQERLDKRERNARQALLEGIAAYLRALNNENEEGA